MQCNVGPDLCGGFNTCEVANTRDGAELYMTTRASCIVSTQLVGVGLHRQGTKQAYAEPTIV